MLYYTLELMWQPIAYVLSRTVQVKQPHVAASDIAFLVTEPPRFGYLALDTDDTDEPITSFSQDTVNSGRLQYVQATANQTADHMVVDVTNGITWLRQLLVSAHHSSSKRVLPTTLLSYVLCSNLWLQPLKICCYQLDLPLFILSSFIWVKLIVI